MWWNGFCHPKTSSYWHRVIRHKIGRTNVKKHMQSSGRSFRILSGFYSFPFHFFRSLLLILLEGASATHNFFFGRLGCPKLINILASSLESRPCSLCNGRHQGSFSKAEGKKWHPLCCQGFLWGSSSLGKNSGQNDLAAAKSATALWQVRRAINLHSLDS